MELMRHQEFSFTVEYIKGSDNTVADTLSRIPCVLKDSSVFIVSRPTVEYVFSESDNDGETALLFGGEGVDTEISCRAVQNPLIKTDSIDLETLRKTQQSEPLLQIVIGWVEKGTRPTANDLAGAANLQIAYSEIFHSF